MTKQDIAHLIALSVAAHPSMGKVDLRATAELWMQLLTDLPYEVAQAAVVAVLQSSPFFPTPAAIREAAAPFLPGALLGPEAAWEEVLCEIRRVGYLGAPSWSNPAVGRAAEALYGSWRRLCESLTMDRMATDRAHFLKLYQAYTEQDRITASLPAPIREGLISSERPRLASGLPTGRRGEEP